jgi:hypothetical protein
MRCIHGGVVVFCWAACLAGCFDLDLDLDFSGLGGCRRGELKKACMRAPSPLATGAHFEASITEVPQGASLVSRNPAVVTLERVGVTQTYAGRAVRPGTARLEVRTSDNKVFDWVEVEVRYAAAVRFNDEWCQVAADTTGDAITLTVGDTCFLVATVIDVDGEELFGGHDAVWYPTYPLSLDDLVSHDEVELWNHGAVAVGSHGALMRVDAIAEGASVVGCALAGAVGTRTIEVTAP